MDEKQQGGRRGRRGCDRYCRFLSEGVRENKDHVFTREARERRNASLEMSHYC